MGKLYDKHGIPFERGDVVKVFHFIGARRKRHYMYKQCLGVSTFSALHMSFSHLDLDSGKNGPYPILADSRSLPDYEIVQSIECDYEDRERKPAARAALEGENVQS